MIRLIVIGAGLAALLSACGGGPAAQKPGGDGDPTEQAIVSARNALATDRVVDAKLTGSRLDVTLARPNGPGEAAISLWYGKLLAQAVVNRLGARVTSAEYLGTDANGGADRRLHPSEAPQPLGSDACRKVADSYSAAKVTRVRQIEVLGGACTFVLQPSDALVFVSDACGAVGGLRDLPGGTNARPSLIQVVDRDDKLRFVLWWIPKFGGAIGQGAGWVQPGWRSCAIIGQAVHVPTS